MPDEPSSEPTPPRFRIATLLWLTTLLASAMGSFGPGWGIGLAIGVLAINAVPNRVHRFLGLLILSVVVVIYATGVLPAIKVARESAALGKDYQFLKLLAQESLRYKDWQREPLEASSSVQPGGPVHSWRAKIAALHSGLDSPRFNEPVDSPTNKKFFSESDWRSRRLSDPTTTSDETHYFAVVDEATVWSPEGLRNESDYTDSASDTLLLVEATGLGVRWYEPRDLTLDQAIDVLVDAAGVRHEWTETGYFFSHRYLGRNGSPRLVVFADGHVEWLCPLRDRAVARALLTCDGGEEIPDDFGQSFGSSERRLIGYLIHWPRIVSTSMFAALAIAPVLRNRKAPPLAGEA